jgi:hypothetical protein
MTREQQIMKLAIIEAAYANPEGTAVVIRTAGRGAVAISRDDRPELWRQLLIWAKGGGIIEPYALPAGGGEPGQS